MDNSLKHVLVDDLSFDYTRDVAQSGVSSFFLGLWFWRRDSRESLEAQVYYSAHSFTSGLIGRVSFVVGFIFAFIFTFVVLPFKLGYKLV